MSEKKYTIKEIANLILDFELNMDSCSHTDAAQGIKVVQLFLENLHQKHENEDV